MKSLEFFKRTLATTLAIVLAWVLAIRQAQAGYTVMLQEVGLDVVATGSGAIDLTGLSKSGSVTGFNAGLIPSRIFHYGSLIIHFGGAIHTGPTPTSTTDSYSGSISGPSTFGDGLVFRPASSGRGDMVGISTSVSGSGPLLSVPAGYVSGAALSDGATYNIATLATLGVTPGTYVWTWGPGENQNFTLVIPTPTSTPSSQMDGEGTIAGPKGRQAQFFIQGVENKQGATDFLDEFGYSDHKSHIAFTTGNIQTVTINGNQGAFTGTAHVGGKRRRLVQFTVSVTANQNPATGDTFNISLSNGYSASGNLTSGQITINTLNQ